MGALKAVSPSSLVGVALAVSLHWDCIAAIASSNSFQTKYSSYEPALEHVRSCWYEKPDFFPAGALESNLGLILFLHPRAPRMMRSPQPLKRGRNSEER